MRKLSFEENLRHRLNDMSDSLSGTRKTLKKKMRPMQKDLRKRMRDLPGMRRDEGMSTQGIVFLSLGVVAGIAAGVMLAQKYGGFGAVGERIRSRFGSRFGHDEHDRHRYNGQSYGHDDHDYDDGHDDFGELSPMEELEERVLEAYRNDPILSERAIDIGAIDNGIIELTGWVHASEESAHAVTIARGTPGVDTVVNRLTVRSEEDRYDEFADRYDDDDSFAGAQWDGQRQGMRRPGVDASEEVVDGLEGYGQAAAGTGGETESTRWSRKRQADINTPPETEEGSPPPLRGD